MWKENLTHVLKNPRVRGVALIISVSAASSGATYIFLNKRLETKYAQLSNQEIAEAKRFYSALNKPPASVVVEDHNLDGDAEILESVIEAEEALEIYTGFQESLGQIIEETVIEKNIFVEAGDTADNFDYAEQLELRRDLVTGTPFIISHDEYFQNTEDHDQITLTYFAGDNTLCDARDVPVDDVELTVGEDHLEKFGFGSKDPNVVYVQNDRLECMFEITHSTGSYTKEVLGFDDEDDGDLKHSAYYRKHPNRKFRSTDE